MTESVFRCTAIVGAGALGSFVGARLARAGSEVLLVARAPHVRAISEAGLRLREPQGESRIALQASTDLSAVPQADLVIVCVKSADTEGAARELGPHLRADALVLSLQNGVANAATLAAELPQRVAAGLAYLAASMPQPGLVQFSGGNELVLGAVRCEAADVQRLCLAFTQAGFKASASPDIVLAMWNKLIVNCVFNAISALAQQPYGVMAALPEVRELQQAVLLECVAVAQADGVAASVPELQAAVERVRQNMPQQLSSTAQDLARARPTEIDHLNGHIVRRARALGIAAPANQALLALVLLATQAAAAG